MYAYYNYVLLFSRTLHKQGMYGGRPVVKRTLIISPGSLVKVSALVHLISLPLKSWTLFTACIPTQALPGVEVYRNSC